ncbi:uncharacterized protein PWA37_001146 [Arxiozyma heterogenica]|uniref:Uncharacterized protein n=1 Tax=Arxiozyma heterogenica TaxID=278026 RepID=A0AAN7WKL7_9SACH|nr:hypothetical protein RI543_004672 [Kazachstania heterogenica]
MDFGALELNQSQQLDITRGGSGNGTSMNNNGASIQLMELTNNTHIAGLFQPVYPLSKKDIFIIRAYKIITKESILNSNHIQQSLNVVTKSNVSSKDSKNHNNNNGNSNSNSNNNRIRGLVVHPQYSNTFDKISKIFNSLLSKGTMGDDTISTKSSIELFQRFQQIIKEIELSFDNSPFSKYFNKINDTLFQIKNSRELRDDLHWKTLSDEILSVYNPRTGRMINQGRKKNNATTNNSNNTIITANNNNKIIANNRINKENKRTFVIDNCISNSATNNYNNANWSNISSQQDINTNSTNSTLEDEFINMTTDLLNSTNSIDNGANNDILALQKKLNNTLSNGNDIHINGSNSNNSNNTNANNNIHNNSNNITTNVSRSIHGPYTQPTSPNILNSFTFPLESNTINNDTNLGESQHQQQFHQQNQMISINLDSTMTNNSIQNTNHRKRRSLGSVNLDSLDSIGMNDILKYTNANKRQRLNEMPQTNKQMSTLLDNTPNSIVSTATITNTNNSTQLNRIDNTNNTSMTDDIVNKLDVNNALSYGKTSMMLQQMDPDLNAIALKTSNKTMGPVDLNILQEVKNSYSTILDEKDKRIRSLENEIALQRQETMWLRKMLIEDMGCVRNLLKDMTNK